jgi:Protein of unknown function (DUF2878)
MPPTRARQIANFIASQLAWFAAVLGAAAHRPLWGTACVVAVIAWHLGVSARPWQEAELVGLACLVGFVFESLALGQGHVRYPSGPPDAALAPYWIVALWGLLAIALNVTLRWLRRSLWLAAVLGGVAGPAAFSAGVRLGGAQFIEPTPALVTVALVWVLALPLLVWLSMRFDGVVPQAPRRHG